METTRIEGKTIIAYGIIGTTQKVYAAFEPGEYRGTHSSLMTIDGQTMGQIGSRRLPAELEALPAMTAERFQAVRAFHQAQYDEAHRLILMAFPGAADGTPIMGEIHKH